MSYVVMLWIIWIGIGLILLGLILYRISLTQYEEDQIFLDEANETQPGFQDAKMAQVKRLEPVIRIFGGIAGLLTLAIVAYYAMDALHQF